jgi:hypothetical protein
VPKFVQFAGSTGTTIGGIETIAAMSDSAKSQWWQAEWAGPTLGGGQKKRPDPCGSGLAVWGFAGGAQ